MGTENEPISYEWREQYHTDKFMFTESSDAQDFPPREMNGTVAIRYERSSAGTEGEDPTYGQAYFPRIGTKVYFDSVRYGSTPSFVTKTTSFEMVSKGEKP